MPRKAREKSEDCIFHVMVKSIKEVLLFKEEKDKEIYISIIKEYQNKFLFKIYAYCLMDNHAHFIIDTNGADISKIMHGINFKYAYKYNRKYERNGHLFQDRFKSKIITDDKYLITVSAYIHNNPLDIKKYKKAPQKYRFSSLGIYINYKKDPFNIIDKSFIMSLFGKYKLAARKNYIEFVYKTKKESINEEFEFECEKTEYRNERTVLVRNFKTKDIVDFICNKTKTDKTTIYIKYRRESTDTRGMIAFFLRCFCNYKCSDICNLLGNVTQSRVSNLCSIGLNLIRDDKNYKNIITEFLTAYSA